jgi:hypothetical protein
MMNRVDAGIDVTAIVKGNERYVFVYDVCCARETLVVAHRWAHDLRLRFSHYDLRTLRERMEASGYWL